MKMNYIPLVRRILAGIAVFCLAVTGLGIQPAQASPPAKGSYQAVVRIRNPLKTICLGWEYTFYVDIIVTDRSGSMKAGKLYNPVASLSWELVPTDPTDWNFSYLELGKTESINFKYKATQVGKEHLVFGVYPGSPWEKGAHYEKIGGTTLDFEVKPCVYAIHGTMDVGATANAISPGNIWDFVGTYDIAGTVETQEDGTLSGQATASLFMDGTAVKEVVTCNMTTPWQGNTTVEIEADPNAWANGGSLDLQFHLDPMPLDVSGIACQSFGGGVEVASPPITVASFDMDFAPLPGGGGSTSLSLQFPGQPGEFKMELIVSLAEADS